MTDRTPRLQLPWLMPAQAQKHVTVNEALARLDLLVQPSVLSRSQNLQPETPVEGEGYILPTDPAGADWSQYSEGMLLVFHEGVWTPVTPWPGFSVYVKDEALNLVHDGVSWRSLETQMRRLEGVERLGVGATPDDYNRVSIRSSAVLLAPETDGSGDVRLVLNKAAPAATSSLVFQSGWSGRAEIGLSGEDAVSLKVSEDGAVWREALKVAPADAEVSMSGLRLLSERLTLTSPHTPSSATAPGEAGRICWDSAYVYVCVATDEWRRAALQPW